MEIDYLNGDIKVFEIDNYIEILAEFIARLRPEISIQRVLGEGKIGELIAPEWADHGLKNKFLEKLQGYMIDKNLSQGSLLANKT